MRSGFSFTEILFAVMILGIGFIMVAAIFPVAIKQTAQSSEEAAAAAIAREAVSTISAQSNLTLPNITLMLPTYGGTTAGAPGTVAVGQAWSFRDDRIHNWTALNVGGTNIQQRDALWYSIAGNVILPSDHRYAWVAMYRRDGMWVQPSPPSGPVFIQPFPYAQVIIIGMKIRNRDAYDATVDLERNPTMSPPQPATLEPKLTTANLAPPNPDIGSPATIRFTNPVDAQRAAEGAFVVISDDGITDAFHGHYNGRVFRVGNYRPDLLSPNPDQPVYELAPGYDSFPDLGAGLPNADLALRNVQVFIVGRGYADHTDPSRGFDANVQDVSVYSTFVHVN